MTVSVDPEATDSVVAVRRRVFSDVGVAELAAVVTGTLYLTGYYVTSIFSRNYGIPELELFRLEYVKTGMVFWLLAGGMVLIPFGAFYLTRRVRASSGLPHFALGWIGNSLNTTVMLLVPLLLSFFATRYEWYLPLSPYVAGFSHLNGAVGLGLGLSAVGAIVVPCVERLVLWRTSGKRQLWTFRLLVEPLRFGCLIVSVYLIFVSIGRIPWLGIVFGRAGSFVAVSVLFVGGITAAIAWLQHIKNVPGSSMVLLLIGFGLTFFYYLAVTSYVFGIYSIPANRGGRMPVTEAFLETSGPDSLFGIDRRVGSVALRGPVYILEQNNETIYFASEEMEGWFTHFVPIHALSRAAVPYIRFERITDGFPRVRRRATEPDTTAPHSGR